jgi:hypothetical protein
MDAAVNPDLANMGGTNDGGTSGSDLAMPMDLAVPVDLAVPMDLAVPVDLAMPKDLAMAADLAKPADLATAMPDLSAPGSDAFDPSSCPDAALSSADATAILSGAARKVLGDATLYHRTRTCTGMTPASCGAWGTPIIHSQWLLTYSGGVTTDYKNFTFPTHLIVFSAAGTPKFTIRHESDYTHDATIDSNGVVFAIGADPMVNTYPVLHVWDTMPKPDRYQDLEGRLGDTGQLHVAQHCARVVFPTGLTDEVAALYKY